MQAFRNNKRLFGDKTLTTLLLLGWVVSILATSLVNISAPATVLAATDYLDPNGDDSISSDYSSTGSSYYTEIDDAVRRSSTPDTSDYISVSNNKNATAFFKMPSIANISSVSEVTTSLYFNDGTNGTVYVQLYDSTETNAYTSEQALPNLNALNRWESATFSGLSLTQADLDGLKVRVRIDKTGIGGPETNQVYAMYAEATYTAAPSISLTTDGMADFGTTRLDTTRDTTSSDLNDPETVQVDSGPANLDVKSTSFSDGSNTWSLGSANGADQVLWEFSKDETNWTTFAVADTLYTLDTNVAQGDTRMLYLRLTTPTSTSSFQQHGGDVTIVATSP